MHACMMIVFKQTYNNLISCNVTLFNIFIKQCNKYLTFIKIALCLIVNFLEMCDCVEVRFKHVVDDIYSFRVRDILCRFGALQATCFF